MRKKQKHRINRSHKVIFIILTLLLISFIYQKVKNNSTTSNLSSRSTNESSNECKKGVLALDVNTRICKFYPSKCNIPSSLKVVDICNARFSDINWNSWKIYEDKKRGFSIDLPSNAIISYDENSLNTQVSFVGDNVNPSHIQDEIFLDFSSGPLQGKSLEQIISEFRNQIINDPYNAVVIKEHPVSQIQPIKFGGVTGYIFTGPFGTYRYLPLKDGYLVVTSEVKDPNSLGYQRYLDQMLATFRLSSF